MLVLTRRIAESISIGESISIRILRIKGSRVQLSISAPRDVAVRRQELPVAETTTSAACGG